MNITRLLPRVPDFPALTIRKDGTILIHQLTVDQFGLMGMQFAIPGCDYIEKTLTIRPSMDKSEGFCKVSKQRSGALIISSKQFLDKNKIPHCESSRVLPVDWNRTKGCIEAKLN